MYWIYLPRGEVDFQRVKQDGIWGVMLKATEGERYLSPAFEKNYQQVKKPIWRSESIII